MLAMLAAAVGALCAEGAVHGMKYRAARAAIGEFMEGDPRAADLIKAVGLSGAVDVALSGEEGVLPFVGYLQMAAENGVTITSSHGSSSGNKPTLTGTGVYSLWAANFLIALLVAVFIARGQAVEPFCESCNEWYDLTERIGVGAGSGAPWKATRQRFEAGQYAEGLRELGDSDGKSVAVVLMRSCGKCNTHEPLLQLKCIAAANTNKPQEKIVFSTLVAASEAQALRPAPQQPA